MNIFVPIFTFFLFLFFMLFFLHYHHHHFTFDPILSKNQNFFKNSRRLKNKCKCDRSEDGEDEEVVKESSGDEEKKDGLAVEGNDENPLTRTPCHDSGIDIRDALPAVPIIPTKKVKFWKFLFVYGSAGGI